MSTRFSRALGGFATRLSPGMAMIRSKLPSKTTGAAFLTGAICAMPATTGEDFFEHKFITNKEPDDIIDFYSTEDFLQILGVFKIAIHFVLAGVEWDTTRDNTMAVHNMMEISFVLTEEEQETASGEKVVGFFQKEERFKNFIPFTPFLMWDQTQCYGYNRREDGTIEVFHRGKTFSGPLPVRLLVMLHARYVIWATEKHINSPAFGSGNLEVQDEQRSNIPYHAFRDFLKRLSIAQQVAIESGKIAAGASTKDAEKTLKTLQRLQEEPTEAYVNTLKRRNLQRKQSTITVNDPLLQKAIDSAFSNMAKTPEGQAAAKDAVEKLINSPDVELKEPRYGGAFKLRGLRGAESK